MNQFESLKKIPRNDFLIYLHQNEQIGNLTKIKDLFDRANKPVNIFCLIIDHLILLKLITCKNYISLPRDSKSFFPSEFAKTEIMLTELGKDYTESKILGFNISKYGQSDPLDSIVIRGSSGGSISGSLSVLSKWTYEEFKSKYKLPFPDSRTAYWLCSGIDFKENIEKKVFISYSWDDDAHKKWVNQLASDLSKHFTVEFDKNLKVSMSPMDYMKHSILSSDFVIIVFTPNYYERASSKQNTGVQYEFSIIQEDLFRKISTGKYIPLLKSHTKSESIPLLMRDSIYIDFIKDSDYKKNLDGLIEHISN